MREDKDIDNMNRYIMQSFVEQGIYEYYNNEEGKLMVRKGPKYDIRNDLPMPETIAGRKIKWVD